jgi:hypothetical protein
MIVSHEDLMVTLPLGRPPGKAQPVHVQLQLLNPEDLVRAAVERDLELGPKEKQVTVTLPKAFAQLSSGEMDEVRWLRLKYEVRADGQILASGIAPLDATGAQPFLLTAAAGRVAPAGRWYRVPVHVKTSAGQPLRGVRLDGTLTWDADKGERKLTASGFTDAAGNGVLQFLLPDRIAAASGDLEIRARRGLVVRSAQHDVDFQAASYLLLDTDKDIYQPGQTLHARLLRFDPQRKAVEGESLDVRVLDEENTLVLRRTVATDAFGVAHLDWAIPANILQGSYRIRAGAGTDEDAERGGSAVKYVRIYRYNLPNFRVVAKPDRDYYLPAQNAEVAISAEYLFGKPVTRGKVRVVEEEERSWNFRKQQWETKEGQVQAGELDRNGHFTARFDLSEPHADLTDEKYIKFRDLDFAAYVTDLTTGRTEQRRFTLRVTRDPIHVYLVGNVNRFSHFAPSFYVSTYYADGAPARCKLQLSSFAGGDEPGPKHALRTLETNKYGLAKVTELNLPDDGSNTLLAEATDRKGLTGRGVENIYSNDFNVLEVTTSHAIHKTGDPIEVALRTGKMDLPVVVDVAREGAVLATRQVRLHNGRANVVFPYDPQFTDEITVTAYSLEEKNTPYSFLEDTATVLYPKDRRLGVAVQLDRNEHRPGEDAVARFAVRQPGKTGAESVLGVKIVDRAVEERAQTDSDFGQDRGWRWWRWSLWSADGTTGFGGISRDDLDGVDLSQPVPPDLDLVAEYILLSGYRAEPELLEDNPERTAAEVFASRVTKQFAALEHGLQEWNERGKLPGSEANLAALGIEYGVNIHDLRDPWGTPYRYELGFEGRNHFLRVISAGPDKRFGSGDDFTARELHNEFFLHYGKLLAQAAGELLEKDGRLIRDRETLQAELLKKGVDFEALRDPWGKPYEAKFSVSGSSFIIEIISQGQDIATKTTKQTGTTVWTDRLDYFGVARRQIDSALSTHVHAGGAYPGNEEELKAILRKSGVDLDELRDPWGNPYYAVFKTLAQYGDRVTIRQSGTFAGRVGTPVTLVRKWVVLMSTGPDRQANTKDDFEVASYSVLVSEQGAKDQSPTPTPGVSLAEGAGAIAGTVLDASGAVIVGAEVEAAREGTDEKHSVRTDSTGRFELTDLKPGTYQLVVWARGFQRIAVVAVPVHLTLVTEVELELAVGQALEMVEVQAQAASVATQSAAIASVKSLPPIGPGIHVVTKSEVAGTPRLRQDFSETMLWEPALATDRRGRARLNFKLADNITTWKLSAIASTKNGELGHAETDLRAFQPFFVEHDPPRILTQGDEIAYPLVLRNYLDQAQTLKASIKPESWFTLLSPAEVPVKVEAGDAARAIFRYRVVGAISDGKQQVSASNAQIGDAAQKPVEVHPFGRPESETAGGLLDKTGTLALHIPEDAIAGSVRATVKVYPDLLAHVVENLEATLERPNGCGEQTISSTYPSLLVTEIYAGSAQKPAVALKAQRYLAAGYERLLRYQDASGGFTYWGHGDPDLALTAYALEFLHHASALTPVDQDVMQKAWNWVLQKQGADGAWRGRWDKDDKDALLQTAYIAQVLSLAAGAGEEPVEVPPSLQKALAFLAAHRDLMEEPYVVASYALAAKTVGDEAAFGAQAAWLRDRVHYENSAAYWGLERNTPFYGWGRTGRLESTALALRALAADGASGKPDFGLLGWKSGGSGEELIRQGLLFLLRNEDKDGMWYCGHTSVEVLKTLLAMVERRSGEAGARLSVRINGGDATTIDLPAGQIAAEPISLDVSGLVKTGENRIELSASSEGMLSAQAVAESYVPWQENATPIVKSEPNANSSLQFAVTYSKSDAATGDAIGCHIKAERVGHRGYGMMLGEVGLPPGADVDRESLERALQGNYAVYRYDLLPDRVVFYLWPTAGGSEFTFQFRPRFAMLAETAPSMLYDYYNPEAAVILKPSRFHVNEGKASLVQTAEPAGNGTGLQ